MIPTPATLKQVPHYAYWKNSKKEINYHTVGANRRVIGSTNQGYKRLQGVIKNIIGQASVMGMKLTYHKYNYYNMQGYFSTESGHEIPLFCIESPKTKRKK